MASIVILKVPNKEGDGKSTREKEKKKQGEIRANDFVFRRVKQHIRKMLHKDRT